MAFFSYDDLRKQFHSGEWYNKTKEEQQSDIDQLRGTAKHTEKQLDHMMNLIETLEALKKGSLVK